MAKQEELVQEEPEVHCLGEMVRIDKVKPNPENPNVHPDAQVEMLAKILQVNGWREAIIVSKRSGMIVKGHGRLQTAKFLNLKKVPVEYQDYADEQAELSDMIADNRVAQHSYVDALKLGGLLKKINEKGQGSLGYTQEEINLFMAAEYVAPKETDRKFVVLETLKLTKEEKAIISGAVQKFCLRISKELEWGDVLAQICMAWQVTILPTMPQAEAPPKPVKQAEPAPKAKKKQAAETVQPGSEEGDEYEKTFKIKRVAGTTIDDKPVMVIRPEDDARYYTDDPVIIRFAKEAKESEKKVAAVLVMKNKNLWITSLETA
jgi:ParB-like chromosome segregation protein Spo0J